MIELDNALNGQSLEGLEADSKLQWEVVEKIKESLTTVKVQIGAFGVVNTIVMAFIAYKITRG